MAYTFLGTYTGTCKNVLGGTITNSAFKVDVYYEQNINNNTTSLKIQPYVTKSGHGESVTWYFKLDGNDYYSVFCNTYVNSRVDGGTAYKTVTHNGDGTCKFTLNVSVETSYVQGANANLNNACMKSGTLSTSITLPTIPRASSFTVPTFTCGSAGTINITRASSSFTHKVLYAFGSQSGTISSSATTSCSWTPDNSLAQQIPNSLSGVGTITVETYNGSTKVGSSSKSFTLNVSGSMYPTIGSLSLSGVNLWNGYYVKNYSQVKATVNSPSGSYGSTITSYQINGNNLSSTASSATSSKLQVVGTNTYTATVYDSRGRSATKTGSIYVYDYNAPSASKINVYRCDSSGNANNEGSSIRVSCAISITNVANSNQNAKTITIKTRAVGTSSWTTKVSATLSAYSLTYTSGVLSSYSITQGHEVQIVISDSFNTATYNVNIAVASCIMNIEQGGVGIGKYHEKGALDVKGEIYIDGNKVPAIKSADGVMEVSQYIDFHHGSLNNDYDTRFEVTNTQALYARVPSGNFYISNASATKPETKCLRMGTGGGDVFLTNTLTSSFIQLRDDGNLAFSGNKLFLDNSGNNTEKQIRLASGTRDAGIYQNTSNFGIYDWTNGKSILRYNPDTGYVQLNDQRVANLINKNGYLGLGHMSDDNFWIRSGTSGLLPHASGGNSSSLGTQSWLWKEIHGKTIYMANSRAIWAANTTDIMTNSSILPDSNNTKCLGYTNNKWVAVYANNGTIQTSDMRYKSDIQEVDNEIFFEMIKGTGVHTYVLNDERVDIPKAQPLTMKNAPQEKIHLGVLAQELAEFEGHEFILNHDEASGYSINNYNLTTAVMSALKVEISRREEAEKRIDELESRLAKIEKLLQGNSETQE